MVIRVHTTVFQVNREDDKGRPVRTAHTYSFASVAQNDFTYPISLAGAKSVWVSNATALEDAEFYLPLYASGGIDVENEPTTGYIMSATFASDGTQERAGFGFDVVLPSATGAGFIGGNCMPPALTVKHTGTTPSTILIHITY